MSWLITGTQKTDPDALAYLAEVERADGQALESGVRNAVIAFVTGCKADGIWNAIKASCILAGARTLTGALVPLVGTPPTNFNFASGDYNRKTGLVGNKSTKYLDSNRNNNADPQNSKHVAVYATASVVGPDFPTYFGAGRTGAGATNLGLASGGASLYARCNNSAATGTGLTPITATGLLGLNRSASASFTVYLSGVTTNSVVASQTQFNGNILIHNDNNSGVAPADTASNARLAFYSIGESLDLALLDARVTDLINAFAAAI
jgi:hypothetical protein